MPKLTEVDKKLIDGVISTIDWDQILKFYKILNKRIGCEQVKIKGVIKKDKVDLESAKDELYKVLEFVIENDLPEMNYGPWVILWVNGEWEISELFQFPQEDEEPQQEEIIVPVMESKLQVLFVPQSVIMKEEIEIEEEPFVIDDTLILEGRLKESIDTEDYVLASKIRDLLEELNKRKK
jgi:hypothetical protein